MYALVPSTTAFALAEIEYTDISMLTCLFRWVQAYFVAKKALTVIDKFPPHLEMARSLELDPLLELQQCADFAG